MRFKNLVGSLLVALLGAQAQVADARDTTSSYRFSSPTRSSAASTLIAASTRDRNTVSRSVASAGSMIATPLAGIDDRRSTDTSMSLSDAGRATLVVTNPNQAEEPPAEAEPVDPTPAIQAALEEAVDDLNLAGLSVAIVRNGWTIYSGGAGFADLGEEIPADGDTVYSLASISKAVAGTIAVRLEEQGRINLDDLTRLILRDLPVEADFVSGTAGAVFDFFGLEVEETVSMPSFHGHTLREILAHTSCMGHYFEGPPLVFLGHHETELDAARALWDSDLLEGCEPGVEDHYSTHAFSFLGAALEEETGESVHDLLADEIAEPLELDTLGFSYDVEGLVPDSNRAAAYVLSPYNQPIVTAYEETSWKRLGGGMESSAKDLARFGWHVLNGDVVPNGPDSSGDKCATVDGDVLNCVLWAKQPGSDVAHAWFPKSRAGRDVATHSGIGRGFTTLLDVYRDDALVISIMTNTSDTEIGWSPLDGESIGIDLKPLSARLADIVLN